MKRGGPLKRRTPLKAKKRPKPSGAAALRGKGMPARRIQWEKNRQEVMDRARGLCEAGERSVCTVRGEHAHHVQLRSRGGSDDPGNLLWVCLRCHDWIHGHPAEATERGWMASRYGVVDN